MVLDRCWMLFRVLDGYWISAGCFFRVLDGCWILFLGAGWVLDAFSLFDWCWMLFQGAGLVLDVFSRCWMGAGYFF